MSKDLVIVESPSKAKTINKYLGKSFTVEASKGHIKDLPKSKLGVEVEKNFEPKYIIIRGKAPIINKIKEKAAKAKNIYLATDPDREGEAISFHLYEEISKVNSNIKRVLMNEITKKGIKEAFKNPTEIDRKKVDSQIARRVLDRLVGYKISPILWKKVMSGLSAGRVQSIALKLICDREKEIKAFVQREFWTIKVNLEKKESKESFIAKLEKKNNKKTEINNEKDAKEVESVLKKSEYKVYDIKKKNKTKNPPPPFITSSLQQAAFQVYKFTVKKTMMIAQKLYEGVNVGKEGLTGLITYMRTDSLRISPTANQELRNFIVQEYGKQYLSPNMRFYKKKGKSQDAHEAIRPTNITLTPKKLKPFLSNDEYKLYSLIWKRFIQTQMAAAKIEETEVWIKADDYLFKASGQVIVFDGYLKIAGVPEDKLLPELVKDMILNLLKIELKQNFTQPPARFTEGSLVKTLEEKGIGRPSTYSSIISTLQNRTYVIKENRFFIPTELGLFIEEILEKHFPLLMDIEFTAKMEDVLDKISEGELIWQDSIDKFYKILSKQLDNAQKNMEETKENGVQTEKKCPKCGSPMVLKNGRFGQYYKCTNEECKHTESIKKSEPKLTDEKCPECGAPLVWRRGRYGSFLACSNYPECKYIKKNSEKTKYICPNKDGGVLVKRKYKKRKGFFYGCSLYPKCKFITSDTPVDEKCPECGFDYMLKKKDKIYCPSCKYERENKDEK